MGGDGSHGRGGERGACFIFFCLACLDLETGRETGGQAGQRLRPLDRNAPDMQLQARSPSLAARLTCPMRACRNLFDGQAWPGQGGPAAAREL